MIFNILSDKGKAQIQKALIRRQLVFERSFRKKVRALLDHQWSVVAKHAEHGVFDIDHVVDSMRGYMIKALSEQYTKIGESNFELVWESYKQSFQKGTSPKELKGMREEFWQAFHSWTLQQAAKKVKDVGDATKRMIRRVIRQSTDAGDAYAITAQKITARAGEINLKRAMRIARTEVHGASSYSIDIAVKSTRVKFIREWISMHDERVRTDHKKANGQRKAQDEPFDVGGEHLRYPGDPKGSAGNVINCR